MRTSASWFLRLILFLLGCGSSPAHGPVFPGEDWVQATPESQGVDSGQLERAVRFLEENAGRDGVRELVIVRHDRLIWKGDIIPAGWVEQATSAQVSRSMPWAHAESGIDGRGCYGFNWWRNGLAAEGKRLWPGAPAGTFAAVGHNNNKCFVIPEWDMVIVRLGLDQADRKISDDVVGAFIAKIGAARTDTPAAPGRTRVSIQNGRWHLNGQVTYPGTRAEGLLMNVRMVNSTFEDRGRPEFDADANAARFIGQIPAYAAHGVRAFTLCLQGGMPGYEGAINSAFNPDGSLREAYLKRVNRVIEACDEQGLAVILGCFYQRQDQLLTDESAVRAAVSNTVRWLEASRFENVVLEISNEYDHPGFDHAVLRTPAGQIQLIELARRTRPGLLVSTSGLGHGRMDAQVAEACDFILIHFNGTALDDIPARIQALKRFHKPIVCNEDDKTGSVAARAAELSVANGASWGLMLKEMNQYVPFEFKGPGDDPVVYGAIKALTQAP